MYKVKSKMFNFLKSEIIPQKQLNISNRVVWVDFIKILSAFLVVFYHLAFNKLDYGFTGLDAYYLPNFNRIFMSFYKL